MNPKKICPEDTIEEDIQFNWWVAGWSASSLAISFLYSEILLLYDKLKRKRRVSHAAGKTKQQVPNWSIFLKDIPHILRRPIGFFVTNDKRLLRLEKERI